MTTTEIEATPRIMASEVPGAPVLFEISMKRAEAILGAYHETHRRAAILFGFSNFLVAGAAVVLGKMTDAKAPLWLLGVNSAALCALYIAIALSCFRALRVRPLRFLFDTRLSFNQIAGNVIEVARAQSQRLIEQRNEAMMTEINTKARHLQWAIRSVVAMACLIFVGGAVSPILQRRNLMTEESRKESASLPVDSPATSTRMQTAAPMTAPVSVPDLEARIPMVLINTDDDSVLLMSANARRNRPLPDPKKP